MTLVIVQGFVVDIIVGTALLARGLGICAEPRTRVEMIVLCDEMFCGIGWRTKAGHLRSQKSCAGSFRETRTAFILGG